MNSFNLWKASIGLAIAITFTSWLGFNPSSLALPESQVLQKLEQVPMFIIVNNEGDLVLINPQSTDNESSLSPGFIIFEIYGDAVAMLDNLQKNNTQLAGKIRVIPISFDKVYETLKRFNKEPDRIPPVILYSEQEKFLAATKLQEERGENTENLKQFGLPLFYVTTGNNQQFIVKQDEKGNPFIPFYMDLKEAQADLDQYKQQFPDANSEDIKIQIIPLLELIQVLLDEDDETMKIMEIIPSEQQVNHANNLLDTLPPQNPN